MMRRLMLVAAASLALAGAAGAISKDGSVDGPNVPSVPGGESNLSRALLEYNTGGAIGTLPTQGGSPTGWGEWEIAQATNTSGQDLCVVELGFPCSGTTTGPYGWLVWTGQTPGAPPAGPASTADYYGVFTPVDPGGLPPTTYTYITPPVQIPWPAGSTVTFGYDNTGYCGLIEYNGVTTWAWYGGTWDSDAPYGITGVLQIKADPCGGTPTNETSWGAIKAIF